MVAANKGERVTKLEAALFGLLRHSKRSAVLQAGERKLRSGRHRHRIVDETAEPEMETVEVDGRDDTRVVAEERVRLVATRLSLRRGADRAHQRARVDAVFALKGVTETQRVLDGGAPIYALCCQKIVQWRGCKAADYRPGRKVPLTNEYDAVLVSIFKRAKEPGAILFDWTTKRERILLSIERRFVLQTAIESSG